MTTIHVLKCWPQYYRAIESGEKTWEIRKNDRDYHVGDILHLRPWDPVSHVYLPLPGRMDWDTRTCMYLQSGEIEVRVTYIADLSFIMPGYVGMSIELMEGRDR